MCIAAVINLYKYRNPISIRMEGFSPTHYFLSMHWESFHGELTRTLQINFVGKICHEWGICFWWSSILGFRSVFCGIYLFGLHSPQSYICSFSRITSQLWYASWSSSFCIQGVLWIHIRSEWEGLLLFQILRCQNILKLWYLIWKHIITIRVVCI